MHSIPPLPFLSRLSILLLLSSSALASSHLSVSGSSRFQHEIRQVVAANPTPVVPPVVVAPTPPAAVPATTPAANNPTTPPAAITAVDATSPPATTPITTPVTRPLATSTPLTTVPLAVTTVRSTSSSTTTSSSTASSIPSSSSTTSTTSRTAVISIVTQVVTASDGGLSTIISSTTIPTLAATSSADTSGKSTGAIWGIVGGVVGGVVLLSAIIFIVWRCTQRRFSDLDDSGQEIKWPELQPEGQTISAQASTLNPLGTRRTGGAGIEMGEKEGEWNDNTRGEEYEGLTYDASDRNGNAAGDYYDPYLGASAAPYPPPQNIYPPPPSSPRPYSPASQSYQANPYSPSQSQNDHQNYNQNLPSLPHSHSNSSSQNLHTSPNLSHSTSSRSLGSMGGPERRLSGGQAMGMGMGDFRNHTTKPMEYEGFHGGAL